MNKILVYSDERLRQISESVTNFDEIQDLIDELTKVLYRTGALGVSAPQLGTSKRIIVINMQHFDKTLFGQYSIFINPIIKNSTGKFSTREGCLSIPNFFERVTRKKEITFTAKTRDQKEITASVKDLFAAVIQHEIDHLDGKLFIDHIDPVKKAIFQRNYKRL